MDPIALGIIAVAVAGVAWLVFFRESDDSGSSSASPAPTTPSEPSPVQVIVSVPEGAEKMTKAQLEVAAREQGVELDKRMTKANMIADWTAKLK
jgi:hypothetical protein